MRVLLRPDILIIKCFQLLSTNRIVRFYNKSGLTIMVLATVNTWTSLAPAFFRVFAQALTVAPVVYTSSTSSIVFPPFGKRLVTSKAFLTFPGLSFIESSVWGLLFNVLPRMSIPTGISLKMVLASRRDWLKPLFLRRFGCNGTGITMSGFKSSNNIKSLTRKERTLKAYPSSLYLIL